MTPVVRIVFWAIVAAQVLFLVGFIVVREAALSDGREVTLQTVPVDPRSLLQGDYAILDYEIARLPEFLQHLQEGDRVYVVLREEGEVWGSESYTIVRSHVDDDLFIRGRVDRPGHLDFGISTYFVPEGSGRIIERAEDVKVVVNVDEDGYAAIKEVLVDGKPFDPGAGE